MIDHRLLSEGGQHSTFIGGCLPVAVEEGSHLTPHLLREGS